MTVSLWPGKCSRVAIERLFLSSVTSLPDPWLIGILSNSTCELGRVEARKVVSSNDGVLVESILPS